jgi:DMSO/TMAO reductase YedYZ molybdopterin-dependent catalytic subunit
MVPMIHGSPTSIRLLFGLTLGLVAPLAAQQPAPVPTAVMVTGAVPHPLSLTAADLAAMPRATAVTTSNGMETTYEGVWVSDVLKKAGAPLGGALRGAALSTYVVAAASDGYQVVFSLGELDPEMTEGKVLLADKANGQPLYGEDGSFRLVVPNDKRGARSLRMLTSLNVVQPKK